MDSEEEFSIECTGRDSVRRTFPCVIEPDEVEQAGLLHCRIFACGTAKCEVCWFVLSIRRIARGQYRIDIIESMVKDFRAKGIPDAILPELCRRLQVEILSSVHLNPDDESERRTPEADRMWERLVTKGIASYLADCDRYVCPAR